MPTDQMYTVSDGAGKPIDRSVSTFFSLGGSLVVTTTEANFQLLARAAYTWQNLGARVSQNNLDASSTIFDRLNGVDQTAQQISIGAGATGFFEDTTGSVTVADGDLINYRIATGSGAHGDTISLSGVVSRLQHASLERPIMISTGDGEFNVNQGFVRFGLPVGGLGAAQIIQARTQVRLRQDVTFSNLRIRVFVNDTDNPSTVGIRHDGVDILLISVPANTTGSFENTDSAAVSAGSLLSYRVGAGTGKSGDSISIVHFHTLMAGSVAGRILGAGRSNPASRAPGVTEYTSMESLADSISTTELLTQVEVPVALDVTDMFVEVPLNSLTTASTTVALRVGGVASALDISIGAGLAGRFEDSDTVSLAVDDLVNWEVAVASGGSGNITITIISLEQAQPPVLEGAEVIHFRSLTAFGRP